MGINNSGVERVTPVFDALWAKDPTGTRWLDSLLDLPGLGLGVESSGPPVGSAGSIEGAWWKSARFSKSECAFPAPASLLLWLLANAKSPIRENDWGKGAVATKRRALIQGRGKTAEASELQEEGEDLIAQRVVRRGWHVFEGASYPDVTIDTAHLRIVIEGKFTEPHPTTQTTWMRDRHQMLRHLDAAYDGRGSRQLVGFFIVEDASARGWSDAVAQTVSADTIEKSLPHRDRATRREIVAGFLGITTWSAVKKAGGLSLELGPPHSIGKR